jgi:spermidine/putrescine transport system substrate-binding protein
MSDENTLSKFVGGRWDRRSVNRALAGLGLASVSIPFVSRPSAAADDIMCLDWTNYHVPEMIPAYVEKWGDVPPVSYMTDDEDAFQKLRTGFAADTAHPNTFSVSRYRDGEVIRPIDDSKLIHWADIFEEIKQVPGVYIDGELWIVPVSWGNSSVVYRPDLVDPAYQEDPTWGILWDERYKGRVAASATIEEVVISAALYAGVEHPFAMTDDDIAVVDDLLRKQRENVLFYWEDISSMEQSLASGEIVAAIGWNTTLSSLKREDVPVVMMTPKEGILTWLDGLVWGANGEGPEEKVYDLMNAWSAPEAGEYLIGTIGYGHTNRKAYELVSAEVLAERGYSDPLASLDRGVFYEPIEPELRERLVRMFDEIKAGE